MDTPAAMVGAAASTPALTTMASAVRNAYRATFKEAVAQGLSRPLVLPYSLVGAFIVPTLWLAVPHVRRPWLYRSRWLVMIFVIVFNVQLVRQASSTNLAFSYATGLMAAWGIISNANLLLWMAPQFDSARVSTRPLTGSSKGPEQERVNGYGVKGHADGAANAAPDGAVSSAAHRGSLDGLIQRRPTNLDTGQEGERADEPSDLVWEPFPADASFWWRLNWALDLVCSFRGAGKSPLVGSTLKGQTATHAYVDIICTQSSHSSQAGPTP